MWEISFSAMAMISQLNYIVEMKIINIRYEYRKFYFTDRCLIC